MTFKLPNSEFWLKSGALLAIAVTLGVLFQTRYRIGIDPQGTLSMTDRVFLVDIKNRVVEKGASYVFAVKNAEPVYEDGREMVKRVAGCPETLWRSMSTSTLRSTVKRSARVSGTCRDRILSLCASTLRAAASWATTSIG